MTEDQFTFAFFSLPLLAFVVWAFRKHQIVLAVLVMLVMISLSWDNWFRLFMLAQVFLVSVIWGIGVSVQWEPKWTVRGASVVSICCASLAYFYANQYIAKLDSLREQHPVVSLSDRLAYEIPLVDREDATEPVSLAWQVEEQLSAFEESQVVMEGYEIRERSSVLQHLHAVTSMEFVREEGFGAARTKHYRDKVLHIPEAEPIPLTPVPTTTPDYDPDDPPHELAELAGFVPPPVRSSHLHNVGLNQFLDRGRMGYIQSRDHVAGFIPHGFYERGATLEQIEQTPWKLTQLELVSLLKHETPVAYVSQDLPRMDQLAEAPTRPLNEFERQALSQLYTDEDLITEEGEHRIQMLGAIRAAKSCLECHSVRRGELLGAFSYELQRPSWVAAGTLP